MSENKIIKCAKCQKNAEIDSNVYRSEYTVSYPIRDKDGKIYCWDCYKNKSHCEGCQKSVANIKFPRSGQPEYPHCNGGYSVNCERISNEVKFICSKECSKKLADQKYQSWKDKLSQGWTKCEECWKFWIEGECEKEGWEWLREEKNHSRFIKLVVPGAGKLCKEHKDWEESGKQWYEESCQKHQEYWNSLSAEDKLKAVKKEYRWDQNLTEIATRQEIPPLVLSKLMSKESHHRHNCPDCQLDNEPTGNDNNLAGSANENDSENKQQPRKGENNPKDQSTYSQSENNLPKNNSTGLIIGGVAVISFAFLTTVLVIKRKKSKK